ncbi:NADH dehydrogenase [ubiquinone] 1 alpha subcomplex subunit 6-like [Wyeomyia smithii]|uniref:NADH dehydrogenase [ubiquinone] 1 alpha subcomplex subunit 6-like n=1 Tax=Wyeomyia smithii TaxID=174621 RepID=UPI002467F90C|nr:NADH dehydrogenase [ubiquinone] 1 alpha subcomplex subunit 6-like [Wyeomyia smithii]
MSPINESILRSTRQVRPILSLDNQEARKRVISLYKSWYRQIPQTVHEFDIPKSVAQCRTKLREEFLRHRAVTDVRVIDMLIFKGHLDLKETINRWKQKSHLMRYWNESQEPKPKDFLTKFYRGYE